MNATVEETIEDMDIVVPTSNEDFELVPQGIYAAALVGLKVVPKPDWLLTGEETEEQKNQLHWTFQIQGGDFDGVKLSDFTNVTWHPKATAHKHAAALFGVPELTPGIATSTRQLAGRVCQIWVVEKKNKKGEDRNYIDKATPLPVPRQRPQRPQSTQTQAVPRVRLQGYPTDEGGDIPFEDGE